MLVWFSKKVALVMTLLTLSTTALAQQDIDIAKLVRDFNQSQNLEETAIKNPVVLVSFSQPKESLIRLVDVAAKANIPLVLRGLVENSVKKTMQKIYQSDPQAKANWLINPRIYKRLNINAVPVVVISNGNSNLIIRGDVPLDYALDMMSKSDSPLATVATNALSKLSKDK